MLLTIISCSSDTGGENESPEVIVQDTVHDMASEGIDSTLVVKNSPFLWRADFEASTNSYKIHEPENTRPDTLTVEKMILLINDNWDSVRMNYVRVSHDTVFVSIPNSEYLTQKIGSTGAESYMATTTFSLTEMKGIRHVSYSFKGGDHASGGVFTRDDFKNFK